MATQLRVLLIEDSDSDAALNVRELERAGYKITHKLVLTGKEMEAALQTQPFDLIISDHSLPQFDSLQALAILKKSGLDIPFLVVSGTIGEEMAVQIMKAGAHDYVIKGNLSRLGGAVERELRDVEDRRKHKQAEEELIRLRQAVETASEVIFLTDREGIITYINPEFTKLYGYSVAEVVGKVTPRTLKSGTMKPEEYTGFWNALISGQVVKGEIVNRTKDGRLVTIDGSASPIFDVQHNTIGFLAIQRDISEARKMRDMLVAQDRLASMGQLAAGVAHELNNLLTGVIGFSDLLLQRNLPDDVKADLKIVNDEAKRAGNIVKNILAFSRKQSEGRAVVDINENIQRVIALRNHEQKVNNIGVITDFASELPRTMANSSQLQQVFLNIIANAEQAMSEAHGKGTLTITTKRVGDTVKACVADDGTGISPENMSQLFTPFFTTKEVGKGTGLGLSICRGIIMEHGGRIYAESEPGKGTAFIVELPVYKPG